MREDQPVSVEQEMRGESVERCEPVVKRGRGRPRDSKNRHSRKMIPPLRASKKLEDLNSLHPGVRQRPSRLLESSTVSEDTSFLTTLSPLSANVETPSTVLKRGRGRPRGSGKSRLSAQVPRRAATTSMKNIKTSKLSDALQNLEGSAGVSSRRQSRLSGIPYEPPGGDFVMPTAVEILEAAEKLKLSRARIREFALGTQSSGPPGWKPKQSSARQF